MTLSLQMRDLAFRLIVHGGASNEASEPKVSPAIRVCETLRKPLSALAGVAGFRSLVSRALTLAKAEAPSLKAVQVAPDGSIECPGSLVPQIDQGEAREAAVTLVAHLLALLLFFIGENLMLQLVTNEVLPDFKFLPAGSVPVGFEAIVSEIDTLQGVSTRLEGLAEQYPPVTTALTTIAGSVRHTASVLAVVAAIKSPKPN